MPAQPFCIFHSITGLPCWGCGTIRAVHALLHGCICDALWLNPLAVVAFLFAVVILVVWWRDYFRMPALLPILMHRKISWWVVGVLIVLVILNWMWNIAKEL